MGSFVEDFEDEALGVELLDCLFGDLLAFEPEFSEFPEVIEVPDSPFDIVAPVCISSWLHMESSVSSGHFLPKYCTV